ncbi:MAG: DUF1819 family protein [Calditrichaceae bacterium]|nr:DUF1819 family protein [Calditrichia bacterium]NUQ44271.1 DUF1819 family protein [Calditrichaceae bacterium]
MKYRLSFTTGSLFLLESVKIARLYREEKDWRNIDRRILRENILQKKTVATQKRQVREIKRRLDNLSPESLDYLASAELEAARFLLLLAVVKTYDFIFEFIDEVVRSKFLLFDTIILEADYARFFEAKAALHPEVASLSETSRAKIKEVLFRILAESGLIASSKNWQITPPYVPEKIIELVTREDAKYLKAFLLPDKDIQTWKEKFADHGA